MVIAFVAFLWLAVSVVWWMLGGWTNIRGHFGGLLALIVGVAMIGLATFGLIQIFIRDANPELIFFFLRATELTSGVSLLLPAFLLGLTAFLSSFAALRRLNLAERMPCLRGFRQRPDEAKQFLRFDHERARSFDGVNALEIDVKETLVCSALQIPGAKLVTLLIVIIYYFLFLARFVPSVDGRMFDLFFMLAFCVAPVLLVWTLMRLFWLWVTTSRLLRRLSFHPLISQYVAGNAKEGRFAQLPAIDLLTPAPTHSALSLSVRQAREFCSALALSPAQVETEDRINRLVDVAESKLSLALHADARGDWQEALLNFRDSQAALAELTEPVTSLLESSGWSTSSEEADRGWKGEGRFFLVTHLVAFLQHIFAHMQNLVGMVTIGLLLLLFATISYPFQPRQPLLFFSWVSIMASVVVTLFIFLKLNSDKTLSLLAGTTPGRLNFTRDLITRVLIHGVVPVIALLGVQFPEVVREIMSWLNVVAGKGD